MDWDTLEVLALGELGMSLADFYKHTPRQFSNKVKGFVSYETRVYHNQMESARMVSYAVVQPHLSKAHKHKRATELFPFPWDVKQQVETQGIASAKAFWDRVDKKQV